MCDNKWKLSKVWLPRAETLILLAGLLCTVLGKTLILFKYKPSELFTELANIVLPDMLFFVSLVLLIGLVYLLTPSAFSARFALLISIFVLSWSVFNTCWLISSRVQLQPRILLVFIRDTKELWPFVKTYLIMRLKYFIILTVLFACGSAFCFWRFLRPVKVVRSRNGHKRHILLTMIIIIILLFAQGHIKSGTNMIYANEILGFSSHWYALTSSIPRFGKNKYSGLQTRNIPKAGERQIGLPESPVEQLPNVILILLESISHSVTPLANPNLDTMPYFAHLADEGVEFKETRIPTPQTSKAFWAVLTSTPPVIAADYAEAIPADQPYESLCSILAKVGYESAFFEMSKGTFECAPSFFNNLGYNWAWFRENLKDPSAHLGYLAGDDCRMIEPAFEWIESRDGPFLLTMISSVAHDPFEVPSSFAQAAKNEYDKYLQAVRYTDYFLQQFCDKLKERRLDKNTILCIMGDHGTSFRVQQGAGRWIPYDEVIRVPWIIRWPGHITAGEKITWPCSQLDVTPTLLGLMGFDISQAGFDGKDAFVSSNPNRRIYFSSWHSNSPRGFIEGNRKIMYWPYHDKVFTYDLQTDPNEQNPVEMSLDDAKQIKHDIITWQEKTQIKIDAKRCTEDFLYSHWQVFSSGRKAWGYYVP